MSYLDRAAGFVHRWRVAWTRAEIRLVPSERHRLFALTIAIGGLCGLAAVAFHLAINLSSSLAIDRALSAGGRWWIAWTVAVPTVGGLLSGVLLQYVVPNARGSGVPQVKTAFALEGGRLRMRDSIGKFFVSTLQIGSGSSLGREGPTVQICGGIASLLSRVFQISQPNRRRLLPVGAAAGIAAAFNAPIAAVTFTVEEVVGNLDSAVLSGAIVAAALAAVVERSVLGVHPMFTIPQGLSVHSYYSLLLYALLGLLAACASLAFTESLLGLRRRFKGAKRIPGWARPGVGGLVTGCLAIAAILALGARGVTGGGYLTLGQALSGELAVKVLLGLCALKLVATVFSYASGGAGGIFAPALFIGAMLGGAVGVLDIRLFGHAHESMGAFALVGMGAVFAGIIRAPITSVLIIVEMTGGYSLILPLMIANMSAYALARHIRPTPIYEALLEQDGVHLRARAYIDGLDVLSLKDIRVDDRPYHAFDMTMSAGKMVREGAAAHRQEVFPVLDANKHLRGIVTLDDITLLAAEPQLEGIVNAADVMRPPVVIRPDDNLRVAFELMLSHGVRELPVVDAHNHVVGFVDEAAIAHAYVRSKEEVQEETAAV